MGKTKLRVLDCTLRDGGYYNNWDFSRELVEQYLVGMHQSGVDAVEIGFRFLESDTFLGPYGYSTDEFLETVLPQEHPQIGVMVNCKDIVTYAHGPVAAIDRLFQPASKSPVDLVRVACHFRHLEDAMPAFQRLKDLGYELGVNLMQATTKTMEEITDAAALLASTDCIDVLYFADSLGNMNPTMVAETIDALKKGWSGPLGIHTHDNQGRALANSLEALRRDVSWLDATVLGMGRGAGNARMEYLTFELAQLGYEQYDPASLFNLVLSHFEPLQREYEWGPNLLYYLSGAYDIHPTYVQDMLVKRRYKNHEMLEALEVLRGVNGSSYSSDKLEQAMQGSFEGGLGTWDATDAFAGRSVLLLGGGPGLGRHMPAVQRFIERENPFVLCLNINSAISAEFVDAYAACHPSMLAMEAENYSGLAKPLLAPLGAIPEKVRGKMSGADVWDFGMTVEAGSFETAPTGCKVPELLVLAYVLAASHAGSADKILLAGFDGFGANDPRQRQSNAIFEQFMQMEDAPQILAITPTTYSVHQASVYAPALVA